MQDSRAGTSDGEFSRALLAPRYWGKWLSVGVLGLINLLPVRLIDALGERIGKLVYRHYYKHRWQAAQNVAWCFPDWSEDRRDALVRDHCVAYVQTLMLSPVLWWGSRRGLLSRVDYRGIEHLERARESGPVIVLACHSVALDFGAAAIAGRESAVSMYQPFKNAFDNWLIHRSRRRFGNTLVRRGDSLRNLVRLTRNGVPCYHMPDEDLGREGALFVPFFGRPKATLTGMSKMTRATRAQVVPCFPYYIGRGRFRLEFFPPLDHYPLDDEYENCLRINREIEKLIGVNPAHYLWKLRIFKTQEHSDENPYHQR